MSTPFDYSGVSPIEVRRVADEPIVKAGSVPSYGPSFNAGAIHHDATR